jgi:hypothetical protein
MENIIYCASCGQPVNEQEIVWVDQNDGKKAYDNPEPDAPYHKECIEA